MWEVQGPFPDSRSTSWSSTGADQGPFHHGEGPTVYRMFQHNSGTHHGPVWSHCSPRDPHPLLLQFPGTWLLMVPGGDRPQTGLLRKQFCGWPRASDAEMTAFSPLGGVRTPHTSGQGQGLGLCDAGAHNSQAIQRRLAWFLPWFLIHRPACQGEPRSKNPGIQGSLLTYPPPPGVS